MTTAVAKPAPRVPLIERIYGCLRDGIVSGEYLPGSRLVESELTRTYGVSRSTVREALRRLHADDLVEFVAHCGVRVRHLTLDDVVDLYAVREPIEALAARLAAEAPDPAGALSTIHAEAALAVESGDRFRFTQLNARLHRTISEMSGNRPLGVVLARLNTQIIGYQFVSVANAIDLGRAHREHETVLAAILSRDPDGADAAMRRHLRSTRDSIVRAASARQSR
jgi:DNA-binding GntR family transcriptional regulator